MFGIEKPIIQGGMQWLGVPGLASAVCNAGGIGTVNISIYDTPQAFGDALDEMDGLTSKPYIVNISLTPRQIREDIGDYLDVCIAHKIAAIEFAGADPSAYIPKAHAAGIRVIHKSPNNRVACRMVEKGADVITAAGYEVAGHPSMDGIGTMVIANRIAASCAAVPVLAAGGIADGKGVAAALALGCSGVVMGTRFVCTEECAISDNHKRWVLEHTERDTVITQRSVGSANRVADNMAARLTLEMENRGTDIKELMAVISGKRSKAAYAEGNVDGGIFAVGPSTGLIHDVKPVAQLLDDIVEEAESVIGGLASAIS